VRVIGTPVSTLSASQADRRRAADAVIADLATGLVRAARAYFTSLGDGLQPRT
jgi:hypothetical protein